MAGHKGVSKTKKRKKPTDLFCRNCLEELAMLGDLEKKYLFCGSCNRSVLKIRALTFDEMTKVKFERAKYKGVKR